MTAVTPAQAAHDAFSGAEAYQCMMGNPSWETITETYRLIWRFAAWAAFEAARAPESYSRPELLLGECPLHPTQREVQVRSRGEWLCLRQFLDLHEQPQPAPELTAAMAETRERLDVIEERIGNLAAGLKLSASASQPSKKSEIEMSVHRALLALLDPR